MNKGYLLFALGVSLVFPPVTHAEKTPMTFEDILGVKDVSDPKISPDGQTVVFAVTETNLENNVVQQQLWLFDRRTNSLRQLTRSGKSNRSPRWSPTGSLFAFLSNRGGKDQIFLMDPAGGEARALTKHETAVLTFRWSPDGTKIAFTAVDPKSAEKEKDEKKGNDALVIDAEFDWPKLWVIDVGTKEEEQILEEDMNVEEFTWSPDGNRLALMVRPTTLYDLIMNTEIFVMASSGGPLTRLTNNSTAESNLVWAANGKSLFYTAADESRFVNAEPKLFRIDIETAQIERLAAEYTYGMSDLQLSPNGARLYFLSGIKTDRQLCAIDPSNHKIEKLSDREGTVLSYDTSLDGSSLAFVFSDTKRLPELWTATLDPFHAEPATRINPQIDAWHLGETKVVQWKSTDGWEVEGLLTLPVDYEKGRRYPLVVVLHGGPESAYTKAFRPHYLNNAQVYAGRGWAVLRPNYRGGSNYGDKFTQGMNADTGGGDFHDIMTGVRLRDWRRYRRSGEISGYRLELGRHFNRVDRHPNRSIQGGIGRSDGLQPFFCLWTGRPDLRRRIFLYRWITL